MDEGRSGGLVLLWMDDLDINMRSFSWDSILIVVSVTTIGSSVFFRNLWVTLPDANVVTLGVLLKKINMTRKKLEQLYVGVQSKNIISLIRHYNSELESLTLLEEHYWR
ncbi:hypothetical protein PanWU01x14_259320 [Parasponia andersonii]|uniref:Uncharacterized protein n=1 Tax=Parasponia andersonii TaxID=3476 RepID=A0A2P5B9A9_PARAD|nr:hypothetical protein PanWU01x14_259320 [Parasponia andersonii]